MPFDLRSWHSEQRRGVKHLLLGSAIAILASAMPAEAQWLKTTTPGIPRTSDGRPNLTAPAPKAPDGKPDLSGIWRSDAMAFSLDVTTDLKPGEILPWAAALAKERTGRFSTDHPSYRCMPEIGPTYNYSTFKFIQSNGTLAMLPEGGPYRQILIDGRALPDDPQPTWMGYSVGKWDGNTMVVESAGFNDRTWLDYAGHPHTEALRTTERYTRKDFGHMDIQITYNDPKAYTRPWTITLKAELMADTELLENVCNENDKSSRQHFFISDDDRRRAQAEFVIPAEMLATYVGPYEMKVGGKSIPFSLVFENGRLYVVPPGGGKMPLVAESETRFLALGAPVIFSKDASGAISGFVIHTVEGDQQFERKR
jgi:hypothetical protein